MHIKILPHQTYIHDEFRNVPIPEHPHSDKFDRLFDFFKYIKDEPSNSNFMRCYETEPKPKGSTMHLVMRKKEKSKGMK